MESEDQRPKHVPKETGGRRLYADAGLTKPSEDVMVTTEPLQSSVGESEGESMEEWRSMTITTTCMDRCVVSIRTSSWLTCNFVIVFLCSIAFGTMMVYSVVLHASKGDITAVGDISVWVTLLCVASFGLAIATLVTQMNEKPNDFGFDFLQVDNNSFRCYIALQSCLVIAFAVVVIAPNDAGIAQNQAMPFAIAAIPFAAVALSLLAAGAVLNQLQNRGSVEGRWKLVQVAAVANDAAIALMIARFVVTQVITAVEVVLFVFLLLNGCLAEMLALSRVRTEDSRRLEAGMSSYESDTSLQKNMEDRRRVLARNPRRAVRDEATMQTSFTSMLFLPAILLAAVSTRHALTPEQVLSLSLPPLLAFLPIAAVIFPASNALTFISVLRVDLRDILPRLFFSIWLIVLSNVDSLLPVDSGVQQAVFMGLAAVVLLPALMRFVEDVVRGRRLLKEVKLPRINLSLKARITAFELLRVVASEVPLNQALEQIDLADNVFSADLARAVSNRLLDEGNLNRISMLHLPSLRGGERSLMLSQTWMDDFHAALLADLIKDNNDVIHLYLSSNEISGAGAKALADALAMHESLELLNLLGNRIGDLGARAMAQCLHTNARLVKLNLSANCIGPKGGKWLGLALAANHTLKGLNLRDNELGSAGVVELASGLGINDALEDLSIASNGVEDEGAQALRDALRINETLSCVHVSRNQFSREMRATLRADERLQI